MHLNYVDYLLSKGKNIYEQIDILKENIDNEEVKIYIDYLKNEKHFSPNMRNIIDKYLFYENIAEEIKNTDCKLIPIFKEDYNNSVKIERVINSGDDVVIMSGKYATNQGKILYIKNNTALILFDFFGNEVVEEILISDIGGKIYESKNN